ncbi:MAG TPA: ABC transporter ATP-binding protein [Pyrinomonadaceae bacterium]|jgi:ABC-type bacteriocin/lantibiotic exporter with double-glycine peptidase domain
MTKQEPVENPQERFRELSIFLLTNLPGWRWKLPLTLLAGFAETAILTLVPLIGARIINALKDGQWHSFRQNLWALALLTLVQTIISFIHRYCLLQIEEQSGMSLRRLIVETVLHKELRFFEKHWVGDIVSRAINDSNILKSFLTTVLLQIVYDGVALAVVVVILVNMNPLLALLTITTAPVTVLYGRVVRRRLEQAALLVRENVAAVTGHLQSWLSRPFAIKIHSLEGEAARRFRTKNEELTNNSVRIGVLGAWVGAVNTTLLSIPSLLIFGYGGYITLNGSLTIGELFAFMTFTTYFNAPIQRLVRTLITTLPTLYPISARVREFLSVEDTEDLPSVPRIAPVKSIRVHDLKFSFGKEPVFHLNVRTLEARRGEIIGIMGPNGAGKSTLARLLAGIYAPSQGEIILDLENGDACAAKARRQFFGFLPQSPTLFDGTLAENVTLFQSQLDKSKLLRIEEELGLREWVSSLANGWETQINAGLATTFSGGQIQKIGLARLLYREAPVLVFDEPANSLDQAAQPIVEHILSRPRADQIVLIIAHSQQILDGCDRVYQLRPLGGSTRTFECVEATREQTAAPVPELLQMSTVS